MWPERRNFFPSLAILRLGFKPLAWSPSMSMASIPLSNPGQGKIKIDIIERNLYIGLMANVQEHVVVEENSKE